MSGLYLSSNTAIAANDPEPMVKKSGHLFHQCIWTKYFFEGQGNK